MAFNRRRVLQWTTWGGLLSLFTAQGTPGRAGFGDFVKETKVAALYHCDYGDPARFGQTLTNISNHLSVYNFDPFSVRVVMVAHGQGLKFFMKDFTGSPWEKEQFDAAGIYERIRGLGQQGVGFYLCEITINRLKLDPAKLQDDAFIKLVPSGVAAVAELQTRGYAYLKIG